MIEATRQAETEWSELCCILAKATLFWETASWIFGTNVAGKKPTVNFYLGGLAAYREWVQQIVQNGLEDFERTAHSVN